VGEFSTFYTTPNMENEATAHIANISEFPKAFLAITAVMGHKNLHHTSALRTV
jgi:hypothetical protein